jgi:hypothetical protein
LTAFTTLDLPYHLTACTTFTSFSSRHRFTTFIIIIAVVH